MLGEDAPTPRRRGPIHIAASALALGGLLLTMGEPRAVPPLVLVAAIAARRLRRPPRRPIALAFAGGAMILALLDAAALLSPESETNQLLGAGASAMAFVIYLLAVILDERWRESAIAAFLAPLPDGALPAGHGRGKNERCVEVPWALARVAGARRVLEVGPVHAEVLYLDALLRALPKGSRLFGLDLVRERVRGLLMVAGDAEAAPFRGGAFDVVLCISTLEHVGRDNRRYGIAGRASDPRDVMLRTARELARLIAPGGRLLITLPFGRPADHGWLANIGREDLSEIEAESGLAVEEESFFIYDESPGGWRRACPGEALDGRDYGSHGAVAASAIACIALRRPISGTPAMPT